MVEIDQPTKRRNEKTGKAEDAILKVAQPQLKPGAKLVPDGVMYDRVAILQIGALKAIVEEQVERIAALERRLA
jgi:hypothetical protein